MRLLSLKKKSLTLAWRHSMFSTKKTTEHSRVACCNLLEAAAAAAMAAVAAVEAAVVAVEAAALEAVEAVPAEAVGAVVAEVAALEAAAGAAEVVAAPAVCRGEVASRRARSEHAPISGGEPV